MYLTLDHIIAIFLIKILLFSTDVQYISIYWNIVILQLYYDIVSRYRCTFVHIDILIVQSQKYEGVVFCNLIAGFA